jgi:hypothetical protein
MNGNRSGILAIAWSDPSLINWKNEKANLSKRLIAVRSLSTSKVTSISTMLSSALGPQSAVTDARQEGEPKVWIWVVLALRDTISVSPRQ